jgi:hypothetical protein
MARYTNQKSAGIAALLHGRIKRGLVWGAMIVGALLAFEMFNFSTTEFALSDLLGGLNFLGLKWATILALAFCGIDFAGIARLFTPEQGADEPKEVWYLFGAWLLAATMNAILTWWGVSIAILQHQTLGNAVIDRAVLLEVVPVFVALMVWLSRVLIIGTFSVAGERLFSQAEEGAPRFAQSRPYAPAQPYQRPQPQPQYTSPRPQTAYGNAQPFRANKPVNRPASIYTSTEEPVYAGRPEPTYHPVGAASRTNGNPPAQRNFGSANESGNDGYR